MGSSPSSDADDPSGLGKFLIACGVLGAVDVTVIALMVSMYFALGRIDVDYLADSHIVDFRLLFLTISVGIGLGISVARALLIGPYLLKDPVSAADLSKINIEMVLLLALLLTFPALFIVAMSPPIIYPPLAVQFAGLLYVLVRHFRAKYTTDRHGKV